MKPTQEQLKSVPFQYASDVMSGKIVVGRFQKLAVERFYNWIENCPESDYLDHKKGMKIINFFPHFLNHTKGIPAGKKFELAPFQQFNLYNIFGWQTPWLDANGNPILGVDGKPQYIRRIKKVYDKRARGNGKTAEMAGIALYMASAELESEAEVYVCATKESQAKVCWKFAKNYIEHPFANPIMKKLPFQCKQREIIFKPLQSKIEALGNNPDTQDALAASFAIIDEYHAHVSDDLLEVIESSMLKRKEPLTYIITTAGFNLHGVCKQFEDVCKLTLDSSVENDSIYISIHEMDEGDDWEESENWKKANPLWGNGLNVAELFSAYKEARNQPSKIPNFKTKHLNMWVDAPDVWIDAEYWDACQQEPIEENFAKLGNCGGLDLSTTTDITAYAMITNPDENGFRDLKVWCFCPKDTIDKRSKEDGVPYRYWAEMPRENAVDKNDTYLIATDGNQVDYSVLSVLVSKQVFKYKTDWVEFDRKFSAGLVNEFTEKGIEMSPFSQSIMNFSSPTKEFERLVLSGKLRVGKNPVLKWMLSGCVPKHDENENVRLTKAKSTKRIDGVIASIMALAGTLSVKEDEESKYNNPEEEIVLGA